MSIRWVHRSRWLIGLVLAGLGHRLSPWLLADDTQWFRLYGLPQFSAGVDVDGSTETTRINGNNSTYENLYLTPLLGLHTTGSIYHPNLIFFDLNGELGWGWDEMTSSSAGYSETRNRNAELLRYQAQFNLLQFKPYNATVYAEQDHTYRDYGSFDSFTVDASRYGTHLNWVTEKLTLSAELGYRDEKSSGLNDTYEVNELFFNFLGINKREFGQTTLTLHANDLENTGLAGIRLNSHNWSAGISDTETFGARRQFLASTGLSYGQSEYSGQQFDSLNGTGNLLVNYTPDLANYVSLNYSRNELRPITTSSRTQGTVGIRHQLYESLTSNLEGHGSYQTDDRSSGTSTVDNYGIGLFENYTKRLQTWGRLSLGTGVALDHHDQQSPQGTFTIFAEPHDLYVVGSPGYQPVFLSQPRVIDSSVIINVASDTLVLNSDYTLAQVGELTEVKLVVPTSAHVQSLLQTNQSLSITVTYQSASLGNASYESLNASAQVRLDLFGHLGIYARLNSLDNNVPSGVLAQTLMDWIAGVDYQRKWLRAGAEYEDYDSNFTRYRSIRLFQNFDFRVSDASSLGFNFNQIFYNYEGGRDQSDYDFRTYYSARLPMNLNWHIEGGVLVQDISGYNLVQGVARTSLGWTYGKLNLRVGYEYNAQTTSSGKWTDEREKHRFYTYLRRTF